MTITGAARDAIVRAGVAVPMVDHAMGQTAPGVTGPDRSRRCGPGLEVHVVEDGLVYLP